MVIINKVDWDSSRIEEVENSIFDLLCSLNVSEDYLDYVTLYGSAKKGFITDDASNLLNPDKLSPMSLVLEKIIEIFPPPKVEPTNLTFH